jgi:hypothetical protein
MITKIQLQVQAKATAEYTQQVSLAHRRFWVGVEIEGLALLFLPGVEKGKRGGWGST